ncbi:unnamed protein product [Laminaria digitata]
MSRLPLPATEADNHPDVRYSDPADIDVYLIGVSGVKSQPLGEPLGLSLGKLEEMDPEFTFTVGERELRTEPLATNEESARVWQEPGTVRAFAGRRVCENLCAVVAEALGCGLHAQGSCPFGMAIGESGDGGGGCTELGVTAYDQVTGPWKEIQRSSIGGEADTC